MPTQTDAPVLPLDDVDQPCGRGTCRHPHDWTGGHCPGARRRPTTSTPVAELAAAVRAEIGGRP